MVHMTTGTAVITAARITNRRTTGIKYRISVSSSSRITHPPCTHVRGGRVASAAAVGSRKPTSAALCAALLQLFRDSLSEVSKHAIRAGALKGDEAFHHSLVPIQPAVPRGRHDH